MPADLDFAIHAFWEATRQGIYYPSEWRGQLNVDEAYQVQLGLLERYVRAGERHAGWKVGLTAKAIQDQIGYHEPVLGFLLESGNKPSGSAIPFTDLLAPSFETELCLTLAEPLRGPGVTLEAARAALGEAAPAFEIVEKRGDFTGDIPLALTDNSQQKFFVTGPATKLEPGGPPLSEATVEIFINGESVEQAAASNVMGDPAAAVAWLADRLAGLGRGLEAGQRIMSGSFTKQVPIAQGDLIEARFEPFGAISAEFV